MTMVWQVLGCQAPVVLSRSLIVATFVGACAGTAPDLGEPPPQPEAGTTAIGASTFAINTFFLGETAPGSYPSRRAWMQYGYDLDNRVTTKLSTDVCTLVNGAPKDNQIDGNFGIDNAFGNAVVPLIIAGSSVSDVSKNVSALIAQGLWTLELQITGLSVDPNQTATGLTGQAFVGANTSTTPTFDASTSWPVAPSSLMDGATIAGGAVVRFATVYVSAGTVVMRDASAPLTLPIVFSNLDPSHDPPMATLVLKIHQPIITFVHSDVASANSGIVAGVVETAEALPLATTFGRQLSTSLCGDAVEGIVGQIEQAQDILADGTNAPDVPCTAISIGLGFTARMIANPTAIGVDPSPAADPCANPSDGGSTDATTE